MVFRRISQNIKRKEFCLILIKLRPKFPQLRFPQYRKNFDSSFSTLLTEFLVIHKSVQSHSGRCIIVGLPIQIRKSYGTAPQAGPYKHISVNIFNILDHLHIFHRQAGMIIPHISLPPHKINTFQHTSLFSFQLFKPDNTVPCIRYF